MVYFERPARTPVRYFVLSALSAVVAVLGYRAAVGAPAAPTAAEPESTATNASDADTTQHPAVTPTEEETDAAPKWRDGEFTGAAWPFEFGEVQVVATIEQGRITDLDVSYPTDAGRSRAINEDAVPRLVAEAIENQTPNVQLISGATFTTNGFTASLQDALNQAHP